MNKNQKEFNIKENIKYIMEQNGVKSYSELASMVGIASQTMYSFLKNPTSNSTAKSALCNYCGISIKKFEETLLADEDSFGNFSKHTSSENTEFGKNLGAMSDEEIFQIFLRETEDYDEDLKFLRDKVIRKFSMDFKTRIIKARNEFKAGDYKSALDTFDSAFYIMDKNTLSFVNLTLFQDYVSICKILHHEDGLEALKEKIFSEELYDEHVCLLFVSSLGNEFKKISEECLVELSTKK